MSGDYTRFTFDPIKGYSGVHKQQGRVSLDADFIEFEEIIDRRRRASMFDTVGQAVVPLTTPDGFLIEVTAPDTLTIGRGRAYVDGILAECFGDVSDPATMERDDVLGGVRGPSPVDYAAQPFFYQPDYPALSATADANNLVYLDVWQREVTVYEDPDLREPALNGPDTATRIQTAWQVKVLADVAATDCDTPIPAWDSLIAASTARLTVQTTPPPPNPGPCIINPVGGYTGRENHLYRVEVHRAGTLGGTGSATFKWSRDNASIVADVTAVNVVSATLSIITVSSTGTDRWRRFAVDQHLELLDDDVEFALRETGVGGRLAKITGVVAETGEIEVDADLTGFGVDPARHPRVRLWNSVVGGAEPLERVADPNTPIPLEDGITITFGGAATDTLHAGDYWVFPARTATGLVGPLKNAPPRGILHHFAKLAIVKSGTPPQVIAPCRTPWPPPVTGGDGEGCCSAVVHPGESIQAAIDSLGALGGCVCLKAGVHPITEPLIIRRGNVTLHGEAPWVIVRQTTNLTRMLDIQPLDDGRNIHVMGIRFEAPDTEENAPMLLVEGVHGGSITDCGFIVADGNPNPELVAQAIQLVLCDDFAIKDSDFAGFSRGIDGKECRQIRVIDNTLNGVVADFGDENLVSFGEMGIIFFGSDVPLFGIEIERNELFDYRRGIQLGEVSVAGDAGIEFGTLAADDAVELGCRIAGNVVQRRGDLGLQEAVNAFAIVAHVSRCEIVENAVAIASGVESGILVAGGNALIARNEVRSRIPINFDAEFPRLPFGIYVVASPDTQSCTVEGNLLTGYQRAIHADGTLLKRAFQPRLDVLANRIVGSKELIEALAVEIDPDPETFQGEVLPILDQFASIKTVGIPTARIAENELFVPVCGVLSIQSRVSVVANRITGGYAGVAIVGGEGSEANDNVIDGASIVGIVFLVTERSRAARNVVSESALGLFAVSGRDTRLHDNHVVRAAWGIGLFLEADADVRGNTVEDTVLGGILADACIHVLTLEHNHAIRCGYRDPNLDDPRIAIGFFPRMAVGIFVTMMLGTVNIDSCHVIDTGEHRDPNVPPFEGALRGVYVEEAGGVRVHACVITSRPLRFGPDAIPAAHSRAILVRVSNGRVIDVIDNQPVDIGEIAPFVDISDNFAEQSALTLIEIRSGNEQFGELIFADNRCTNLSSQGADDPAVDLFGTHVIVTGNRIHKNGASPSTGTRVLRIEALKALTAMGNMTNNGAEIIGASEIPAPYPSFNVITP